MDKTEYTLDQVKSLQRHVQRNASLWMGLRDFYFEMHPKAWNQSLFFLWGPMAEEAASGVDVVAKHFGHLKP